MQEMLEGPATTITFLGIELDSVHLVACLPADKLARVWQLVSEWGYKKVCTKQDPTTHGHSGTVWSFLLAPDDRPIHYVTGTAPSHPLEQGVPLRPAVVDTVRSQVEWEHLLIAGSPGTRRCHGLLRCLGFMGVRRLYRPILAPGTMATVLVNQEHHWEGDAAYSACSCSVGAGLA